MPLGCPWGFCFHFSEIDVANCQIVNTPLKAAKDFYSRIERLGVFRDSVFSQFQPDGSLSRNHSSGATKQIRSEASHSQSSTSKIASFG